jgi:hypothetical protein
MIMRRLIAWGTGRRAAAVRTIPTNDDSQEDLGLALEEFGRLLQSQDPADLKRLADALSRPGLGKV